MLSWAMHFNLDPSMTSVSISYYIGQTLTGKPRSAGDHGWQAYLGCRGHMLGSVYVGASIGSWRLGLLDEDLCSWRVLLQQQA